MTCNGGRIERIARIDCRRDDPRSVWCPYAPMALHHPDRPSPSGKRLDWLLPHLRTAGMEPLPGNCSPADLMTAAIGLPRTVRATQGGLLTVLQDIHQPWLQEIQPLLERARGPQAGIHCRWSAVQYLSSTVSHRFELERAAVEGLGQMIAPGHAAHLWLAAEFLAALHWQLDHELGLCHRPDEFSVLTHKFEKAMLYWCRAVEEGLGELSWDEIPGEAQRRFALLGAKEAPHGI